MISNYKELETFPNTQIFQDLEVRQIDTGFAKNDFNENYESFKDTKDDRFTREQYDIKQCLEELKDEELYMFAIYKLYTYLRESPIQTFNCFTADYFNSILDYIQQDETREYSLLSLCYIIQIIKNHESRSDCIKILFDFDFFGHLNEIIKNNIEIIYKNYCLFLAMHSFYIEEFQEALIGSGILETAKSLKVLDKNTNILISRLFETAFSIQNKSIIDHLCQEYCDYLLNLAFYGDTSISRSYGLRGLLNLFKNFPEYTSILGQNCSINLLKENLSNKNEKIRNYSSEILTQCITNPDFPILKLYEYNLIRPMLETFEWDDKNLCMSSVQNIKELVYKNSPEIIQQIVKEINKVNFLNKLEPLPFNVKIELIFLFVDLFIAIDSNQVELIVQDSFLDFLYDLINTGEGVDSIALILLNILNKSTDEQFTNAMFEFFYQKSLVSTLEDFVEGNAQSEEISHVELLIKVIKEHISKDANN